MADGTKLNFFVAPNLSVKLSELLKKWARLKIMVMLKRESCFQNIMCCGIFDENIN